MEQTMTRSSGNAGTSNWGTLICWKSVLGGVLVSFLAYMILSALGAGIGGLTAAHIIEKGENASGLATGAGLWIGGSAVLSLFLGSYFATRFSEVTHKQIGASQAILIAAIFFYLLINVAGSSVGSLAEVASHFSRSNAVSEADAAAAAKAVGEAGWLLFVTLVFGVGAAILGGVEGAIGNVRRPFTRVSEK
jgi:hypothetical protein